MQVIRIFILFCYIALSNAQTAAFSEFNTSRYTRVISLGNAFTGLADGIETVYYNSAGLAHMNYYGAIYSYGQGFTFVIDDYTADNFAVLIPAFKEIGIFALSADRLIIDSAFGYGIYKIHMARMYGLLSVGVSLNYYNISFDQRTTYPFQDGGELNGNTIDISLSALYIFPVLQAAYLSNETRLGIQLQNLFDSDMQYNQNIDKGHKHQSLRIGFSSTVIPDLSKVFQLNPLKITVLADAVFFGNGYDFALLQPNFGLELTLFEYFKFRYGRENQKELKNVYNSSPQHPVKRYGFGIMLPVHKIISQFERIQLSFDYSYSDWDKIDESRPILAFISQDLPVRESFSLNLAFQY